MGHKDLGVRNYNPSLAAQQTKAGKAYLARIRKMEPYERFLYWIKERHAIHLRRFPGGMQWAPSPRGVLPTGEVYNRGEADVPPPWTDDPILQTIFFCNVYRENDKVTAFLRDFYRSPHKNERHVMLGTILLRWYNYIPTMSLLINAGIPQSFNGKSLVRKALGWDLPGYLRELIPRRDDDGQQLFGGAYIIRPIVDGKTGARKVESIGELMTTMARTKNLYDQICGNDPDTSHNGYESGSMAYAFDRLTAFSGMGKFYVYQFIGDLAYTHVLRDAPDWFTWGFCGPGTSRALVRLKSPNGKATLPNGDRLPRLMKAPRDAEEQLLELQKQVNRDLKLPKPTTQIKPTSRISLGTTGDVAKRGGEVRQMQYIHMRDLCNCLCEYDKYDRALYNERSIKRPYSGQAQMF